MQKKYYKFILYFLIGSTIFLFTVFSNMIELFLNKTYIKKQVKVAPGIHDFHQKLFIADLHADSLLWDRDLTERSSLGQLDLPRLLEGNVAFEAFMIVTRVSFNMNLNKSKDRGNLISLLHIAQWQQPKTWFNNFNKAISKIKDLKTYAQNSHGRLRLVYNKKDLEDVINYRRFNKGVVAGIVGLEGLYPLEENLGYFELLYEAGVRMMALTHFQDTIFAGSGQGEKKGGLTEQGKKLIEKIKSKKLIIDLAHLSQKATLDILAMVKKPVVVSHTGVQGTCESPRNLSDKVIKKIAKNGGVIGISFFKYAICGSSLKHIVKAISYVRDLVGINHIALGSDFDGAVKNVFAVNQMVYLTEALLKSKKTKFSKMDIAKIMGKNTLRVLRENL